MGIRENAQTGMMNMLENAQTGMMSMLSTMLKQAAENLPDDVKETIANAGQIMADCKAQLDRIEAEVIEQGKIQRGMLIAMRGVPAFEAVIQEFVKPQKQGDGHGTEGHSATD